MSKCLEGILRIYAGASVDSTPSLGDNLLAASCQVEEKNLPRW